MEAMRQGLSKDDNIEGIVVYMTPHDIENHKQDVIRINKEVSEGLKGTNFERLDFCDVGANGIQVRLMHKEIKGYCTVLATVKYSWDNVDEVIKECIEDFKSFDNPKKVMEYKNFLAEGEKYGWD